MVDEIVVHTLRGWIEEGCQQKNYFEKNVEEIYEILKNAETSFINDGTPLWYFQIFMPSQCDYCHKKFGLDEPFLNIASTCEDDDRIGCEVNLCKNCCDFEKYEKDWIEKLKAEREREIEA